MMKEYAKKKNANRIYIMEPALLGTQFHWAGWQEQSGARLMPKKNPKRVEEMATEFYDPFKYQNLREIIFIDRDGMVMIEE